jgi:hypothetical protein
MQGSTGTGSGKKIMENESLLVLSSEFSVLSLGGWKIIMSLEIKQLRT